MKFVAKLTFNAQQLRDMLTQVLEVDLSPGKFAGAEQNPMVGVVEFRVENIISYSEDAEGWTLNFEGGKTRTIWRNVVGNVKIEQQHGPVASEAHSKWTSYPVTRSATG